MDNNTSKISWRHHYIPQFYLNRFTANNGKFKIYDVKQHCFVKNAKDFSPRSYFFERNGNTLFSEEGYSNFIEDLYGTFETKIAQIFDKIDRSSSLNSYNIDDVDIPSLLFFVALMYWRIPFNYDKIIKIVESNDLKELGLVLKDNDGGIVENIEIHKKIKENPTFFKSMKFWYPLVSYPEIFTCNTPLHIQTIPAKFPSICSDNPIITTSDSFRAYTDDFIFPLDVNNLFIRCKELSPSCMNTIKVYIDCLTYKQAFKYVACTDEEYIYKLDTFYNNNYKNLNELRSSIFKQISC